MLWVYEHYKYFNSFSAGIAIFMSKFDVSRRQILTYGDGPRAKKSVQRSRLCSAVYVNMGIVQYKEPLKSFDKSRV